jgi:hypothetical protein
MKARTSLLLICLAATSASIGWAQTVVRDNAGKQWTCRTDDKIYTRYVPKYHIYDIKAAKAAGEVAHGNDHLPLCIDALDEEEIFWSWHGATNIKVSFTPLTNDGVRGTCWTSHQPFLGDPNNDSKNLDFLASGKADDDHSGCAYEVKFTSSIGVYDPHIIINGRNNDSLKELQETLKHLEARVKKLKSQLKDREEKKK